VSAIPFALAQRGASKVSVSKPTLAQGAAANMQASQFPVTATIERPTGGVLWYNGDLNGPGLPNEQNTSSGEAAHVYDDFLVTDSGGWEVTAVFSDNLENTNVTGATWEIRQGMSAGNCGILIASGETMTPVVTPTGRSGFGFTEYMIEVTGLNVNLPPGTYWLNVTPVGDLTGRSFDSNTGGTNCVGTPCGNDQNAFWNCSPVPVDFSMGVIGSGSGGGTPTPTPTPTGSPTGGILWYNGDFNGVNGLSNEQNTSIGEVNHVYDDFLVTDSGGWDVTAVFSDNLENTNVTGATWEIRQGISAGNCGILIDSGMTMTPVVTPTGRSAFGFTEYQIEVTGLAVHLPFSTGLYWLNVTPIGDGTGRSFDSITSGANCVGTPCGNDQNAFFSSSGPPPFGPSCSPVPEDFSMGVIGSGSGGGTPTPTPTSSPTATATATATATPTATVTAPPRSTPIPRPRPTPAPRP
jgi:hypothetical protein